MATLGSMNEHCDCCGAALEVGQIGSCDECRPADEAVYLDQGYQSRIDYLKCLAEDHGVDLDAVLAMASTLGPNEDFDGLVTAIEDMAC